MRIKEITVKGLFGIFDHHIELSGECLTFIHSLNGMGKSTTLKLVCDLFDGNIASMADVPFDELLVLFEDGTEVKAVKADGIALTIARNGVTHKVDANVVDDLFDILYLSPDRNMHFIIGELAVPAVTHFVSELNAMGDYGAGATKKTRMLVELLNSLFVNKTASLDENDHLQIVLANGTRIGADKLSAGEKQVLIIFYQLIFNTHPGTMAIIDEPELSLHIVWQQALGDIFLQIGKEMDIQILVATHSPAIIHDKWDLARELGLERA